MRQTRGDSEKSSQWSATLITFILYGDEHVAKGWEDGRQEGDGEGTLRLKSSPPSASTCSPQKDPEWLTFASYAVLP
ncbi:hypothetical protein JCM11641_001839 [Rhodosporidiobolus odoratus]